ncbi:MAG TPA: DUF1287 domain-containing protein [Firmicutes bacterium]|nr:DUF1287 domain-containing protein [Bacillota bacterium]
MSLLKTAAKKIKIVLIALFSMALFLAPVPASLHILYMLEEKERSASPPKNTALSAEQVVANARSLVGRPYDQFMGGKDNLGKKLGGIVCIDVVNTAYKRAGICFERELRSVFRKTPEYFSYRSWNNPWDRNFARRVRNFRAYCRAKDLVFYDEKKLKPGDVVIFGTGHIALVDTVSENGFTVIEAAGKKYIALRAHRDELYERNIERYGKPIFARILKE